MKNYFPAYRRDDLTEAECHRLVNTVMLANQISQQAAQVEQESGGSHLEGDRLIQSCYSRLAMEVDQPFRDGKKIKDCLSPGGPLERTEYRLIRNAAHPLPTLALVRIDPWKAMGACALLECVAGPDTFERFCPVNDRLLADGSGVRYADTRPLSAGGDDGSGNGRWTWMQRDAYVRAVTEQQYLLERGGNLELARLAKLLNLVWVQGAFRIKVFCDYLRFPPSDLRYFRRDEELLRDVTRLAFSNVVPDIVLDCPPLAESAMARMEEDFEETVLTPMRRVFNQALRLGGAAPDRSLGSVYPQWNRWQLPLPGGPRETLHAIDAEVENFVARTIAALLEKRSSTKKNNGKFPGLDVADLESSNRVRKYMAVTELVRPEFESFLQDPRITERYQLLGKKLPCCPMPLEGIEPLEMRLKTALFCLLVSDLKSSVNRIPETVFQWSQPANMGEEEAKANKGMHEKLCVALRNRLVVEELKRLSPVALRLCEAWTTLYEERFRHAACGVDSVDNLLVPCVFFHNQHFDRLLAPELPWYRESWLGLRRLAEELVSAITAANWPEARRLVGLMFEGFRGLQLRMAHPSNAPIANPISLPIGSFFDAPKTFFSERMMQIKEAAAPIQIAMAPPGDPAAYARLVDELKPHIQRLRQIQSQPLEEQAVLAGHARFGPILDRFRMAYYPLGENLFSRVSYSPQPIPGRRRLVTILMDFSGSMNAQRVATAKEAGVVIAEGLRGGQNAGPSFDLEFYLYYTTGSFYLLHCIYKSSERQIAGHAALASITNRDFTSGEGWNPDAAALLAMKELFDKNPDAEDAIVIHLGDHDYCNSLLSGWFPSATAEVEYAVQKLSEKYHYIAARVGKDEDPISENIPHRYLFFPETGLSTEKAIELYQLLKRVSESS